MFMRVDKLQAALPAPKKADPNAAAALQELLGGKYGEMSTLGNYMFQSFNFRSKEKLRPFYSLVASITAEELGHVELVSNGVAMLNNGPDNDGDSKPGGDVSRAPFEAMKDIRLAAAFLSGGGGAMPVNSNGISWNNDFVTTTGNVVFDLLHNFHLECGARLHKLRVYETLSDPTGREVCGYLLVRGSVHAHSYALALKKITGVELRGSYPCRTSRSTRSLRARNTYRRVRIAGCIRSARATTRRWLESGAMVNKRCPLTRLVSLRLSMACQKVERSTS
jgi:Mn-containing catalase